MMSLMFVISISNIIAISAKNKNPVKLSIMLMITATLHMMALFWTSSNTWFPLIFHMLFLGGILIMFLILSTINPNIKMWKKKNKIFKRMIIALMMSSTFSWMMKTTTTMKLADIQWFTQSKTTMIMMTMLISIYFIMFSILIAMEKKSLRSTI